MIWRGWNGTWEGKGVFHGGVGKAPQHLFLDCIKQNMTDVKQPCVFEKSRYVLNVEFWTCVLVWPYGKTLWETLGEDPHFCLVCHLQLPLLSWRLWDSQQINGHEPRGCKWVCFILIITWDCSAAALKVISVLALLKVKLCPFPRSCLVNCFDCADLDTSQPLQFSNCQEKKWCFRMFREMF